MSIFIWSKDDLNQSNQSFVCRRRAVEVRALASHQSGPCSISAQCHIWVEFAVGSCFQGFTLDSPVFHPPKQKKTIFPNSNSIRIEEPHENQFWQMRLPLWVFYIFKGSLAPLIIVLFLPRLQVLVAFFLVQWLMLLCLIPVAIQPMDFLM